MHKNKYAKEAKKARKLLRKYNMCESKVAFDNETSAFQKNQTIYKCPYCGKYHRSGAFVTFVNTLHNTSTRKINEEKNRRVH